MLLELSFLPAGFHPLSNSAGGTPSAGFDAAWHRLPLMTLGAAPTEIGLAVKVFVRQAFPAALFRDFLKLL